MGITYVDAEVSNEAGVARTVRFLVDSGAAFTVLPHETWRALGLQPTRTVDFALADGSIIRRDISHCFLKFQDVRAPTPVVLGEANDAALLGTLTLESMALVLDPFERTLRPARLRLGAVGPAGAVA
ncbi:MAG TPA: retroviral-like aspartic protease family protein [Candidatus Limnocylindria bacterium]|jgi:predicted aspartyl protease|nr:retroviral-like aspartic protease family protein [Candidatus Limnocylindria bacterium]